MQRIESLSRVYAFFHAAKALVSMLGPIYLLSLGFDLRAVLAYCLVVACIKVPSLFVVFNLAARFTPRATMCIGVAFMALHFVWFASAQHDVAWLVVLAALLGVANAFFYPSFRICFSLATAHTKTSRNVARLNNYTTAAAAVAPVIGGVLASLVDIRLTYFLAACIFSGVAYAAYRYKPSEATELQFRIKELPRGGAFRDYISNASYSFSGLADLAVWPLYVALLIPSYAGIGLYAGLVVIVAVAVQALVGRIESGRGERLALFGGVVVNFLYNTGRAFAVNIGQLIGLSFVGALGGSMLSGAYGSRFYKNIHPEKHLEYLFGMEFANSVTWLLYFPVLLWASFSLSYTQTLQLGVLIVIPAMLGMTLMRVFTPTARS